MLKLTICIFIILSFYTLLCLCIYAKPEYFFYMPYNFFGNVKNVKLDGFDVTEVVYHTYDNMNVKGWLYKNTSKQNNHKVVLFLHGNAYNIEKYYHKLVPFADNGYSVFIPEYRGFGGQGKKIRQKFLTQDSLNASRYLNSIGFENEDIIIYGFSLGSHTALYTTVNGQDRGKYNALILEVPFTSLLDVVKVHTMFMGVHLLPLDLLVKDKYNNSELIGKINTRLLVMTTKSDKLIPYTQALKLYEEALEPKDIILYHGASHDLLYNLRNYNKIMEWLEK